MPETPIPQDTTTNLLEDFLDHYSREYDYYSEVARICFERCKTILKSNGIRAIVTYRAKSLESLRGKITQRREKKAYKRLRDIYEDIPDLAGVRIALYFPQDKERVGQLLQEHLEIFKTIKLPEVDQKTKEGRIFKGYVAEHYRARIKDDDLAEDQKKYSRSSVEIQVASVLMHAWSEVEHDLIYKPLNGVPSTHEIETLDQLNGLVLSGEIALKHLQEAIQQRNEKTGQPFNNHYELAGYIYDSLKGSPIKLGTNVASMSQVDTLWRFLQYARLNESGLIMPYIESLKSTESRGAIPTILARAIILDHPELKEQYLKASREIGGFILPNVPLNSVIKGTGSRLYWYGSNAKRYTFPNDETVNSWFVEKTAWPRPETVSDEDLSRVPIGGNVTYRPGARILKRALNQKIFAVSHGGILRQMESETVAEIIFGENWRELVDIIPDGYFMNYTIGPSISNPSDYDRVKELESAKTVDENQVYI